MIDTTDIPVNSPLSIGGSPAAEAPAQGERFFLLIAIFIGIFSGLAVVCFRITIEFLRIELMGSSLTPSFPRILLAPAATGLVVAILVMFVFPRVRGSGVNQTKSALYVYDGYIPFRDNIDQARRFGARYVAEPGGSLRSHDVLDACKEYGMTLVHTHLRLFHH